MGVHSETELFRLKKNMNEINERFASAVKKNEESKEDEDVYQIDFGRSVLIWLKYGEHGTFDTFKQEIISNPASTINAKLFREYELECLRLCNLVLFDINLSEMLSLKLYTDTTAYQSALRRAFWSNASKQERRNFFQWAITLYIAFQRYSKPIIRFDASEENERPIRIYHGLNNTFAIDSGLPFYFGIISLTASINTANKFANGTGLLWHILTSYTNKFRAVIGISTDWFSSFKNEAEIISFNTILPIQKTKNFAKSDDEKINILMKQLEIFSKPIIEKTEFYKQIGFKFNKKWKEKILSHPKLLKATPIKNNLVIHRILHELDQLKKMREFDVIRYDNDEYHDDYQGAFLRFNNELKGCQYLIENEQKSNEDITDIFLNEDDSSK